MQIDAVFRGIDRVSAPISRMQARVGRFTRKAEKGVRRVDRVTNKMAKGIARGAKIAGAAMLALGLVLGTVGKTGIDFEQSITNAAVKFPGEIRKGTAAFEALEKAALDVGSATEFSASEAASALNFLAMAGFDAEQAVGALPLVVDLATAANLDLATATDIATDTLGAFNLASKDAIKNAKNLARVTDVLAKTAATANTTVEEMFEAVQQGGPVAKAAGASIETFSALVGTLGNAGIKGAKAGTTLKNVFATLAGPTGQAASTLRKYGVSVRDLKTGDMRDVIDIIEDLNKGLAGLGTGEKSEAIKKIFGKIPLAGVNVLLASGSDKLREYRKELENAGGAAADMAAVMRDTTGGSVKALKSAIEGVVIQIFKLGGDRGVKGLIDKMTEWVRKNQELIVSGIGDFLDKITNNMETIVKWAKRIAIGIGIFLALAGAVKVFIGVMTVLNLVMSANPISLIIIGVAALIVAFTAVVIWAEELKAKFDELNPVAKYFVSWLLVMMGPIGWLIAAAVAIKTSWGKISKVFVAFKDAAIAAFGAVVKWLKSAWVTVSDIFVDVWNSVVQAFEDAINYLIRTGPISWIIAVVQLIRENWEPITEFFAMIWEWVVGIFSWAAEKFMIVWRPVSRFFKMLWDFVSGVFMDAVDFIGGIITKVFTWAVNKIKEIWEPIEGFFETLWGGIESVFEKAVASIKEILQPLTDAVSTVLTPILDAFEKISEGKDKLVGDLISVDFSGGKIQTRGSKTGFDDEWEDYDRQTISPQQQNSMREERTRHEEKQSVEVTIKDETGKATVTSGGEAGNINLVPSGAF